VDDPDWPELFKAYEGYHLRVMFDDPSVTIGLIRELADAAPDDDHLAALAISLVETYIHQHAPEGFPHFEAVLQESANLRKAWSYSIATVAAR
jgi:hypothetical protein